jgi:hypothetical protein
MGKRNLSMLSSLLRAADGPGNPSGRHVRSLD